MKQTTKQQMVEGALHLLAMRGLQATSFSEVLAVTKAPRGSIYYHFPGGKDELVAAAMSLAQDRTIAAINALTSDRPEKIVGGFADLWRQLLQLSHFRAGCSVAAVTVATESNALIEQAGDIFNTWHILLSSHFVRAGLTARQAEDFASLVVVACEGAVIMARATKSIEPLERVARQLALQAQMYSPA